jgi:hypothetical protein
MFKFDKIIISLEEKCECLSGSIIEFTEKILIARCQLNRSLVLNQKVNVLIYNKLKGEVEYEGRILNTSKNFIILNDLKHIQANQRRKETRVNVAFDLPVKKINVSKTQMVQLNKVLLMQARDISSGGILLNSALDIPKYVQFHLDLPIEKEIIPCTAEIIRKEKKDSSFFYGCKLTTSFEHETDKIRGSVFKKQISERRNYIQIPVKEFSII